MRAANGPRVSANDWSVLSDLLPDATIPRRTVSVVIPAYRAERTLPYTLAALAVQSYPRHLLEVVVVDDDDGSIRELPEIRPERTRLIRATSSWGRAAACHDGVRVAEGEVIHWLDADMVPCRDEVAAHMRWHHVADHCVVLGHKTFVAAEVLPPVGLLRTAVDQGDMDGLFAGHWTEEHAWVEKIWNETADLTAAHFRAFHVHVGSTASVARALYSEAGGMDTDLKLGEDIELGYRLATKGAVFVGDREATNWHLGRSTVMEHEGRVRRHNGPYIAERVPDLRRLRQGRGRMYRVPLVEVVIDTTGHSYDEVRYTVDGVLQGRPGDVRCLLLGPWDHLDERRRHPLDDAMLETRLVREEYASDGRVTFGTAPARTAFPASYRLLLPVGWSPGRDSLEVLLRRVHRSSVGLHSLVLPDGRVARLERTAAFERAHRVRQVGEELDQVVAQVAMTSSSSGVEEGFHHPVLAPPRRRIAGEAAHSRGGLYRRSLRAFRWREPAFPGARSPEQA